MATQNGPTGTEEDSVRCFKCSDLALLIFHKLKQIVVSLQEEMTFLKFYFLGAGEMSPWVKCLLCKFSTLVPKHKPNVAVCICNPNSAGGEGSFPNLSGQSVQSVSELLVQ